MVHAFIFTNEAKRTSSRENSFSPKVVEMLVGNMLAWLGSHLAITSKLDVFKSRHDMWNHY